MKLGHWCGPSLFDVGDVLCNAVLNSKEGSILHKTSVFPLKAEETASEEIKQMKLKWDAKLREKLGDGIKGISIGDVESKNEICEGCCKNNIKKHNGVYCLIKDWKNKDRNTGKTGTKTRFVDLIKD